MRWLWGALFTGAIALSGSGCGSSGSGTNFVGGPGTPDASLPFDATVPTNLLPDSSTSGEAGGGPTCTPRDCTAAGANCGKVADGCGGIIDCGTCGVGESCGGGGTPSVCGGLPPCVPKTCSDPSVATLCGQQPDGCGGVIAAPCVTCTGTQTCGGGGTPNQCGGASGCVPATTCPTSTGGVPMNCGVEGNGCGGTVSCGTAPCPPGEVCGGAGIPNVCGSATVIPLPDGGSKVIDAGPPVCIPIPQATACNPGGTPLCGPVSNGCGGTWSCATCTGADTCGGGGTPSVCGHPPCTPVPITTACTGAGGAPICGSVSNGCGGTYTCPTTCTAPAFCGGNPAAPGTCGTPPCTPLTTCPSGVNCGPWPDGCGGVITSCGKCTSPAICGGGGVASQCGTSSTTGPCDAGLKCDLNECDGGSPTVLKGTIYDPAVAGATWTGGKPSLGNPLYNIVVYVPNTTPSALTHGQPSCESCSSLYTGDPIVSTTTDTNGNFVLTGVPVPASGNVPIVIQVGKWRRQWVWPGVAKCGTTTATQAQETNYLHLPGAASTATPSPTTTMDDLPQVAVSTGSADSMECLFKRIGFAANEYVCGWNGGTGHLHIFQGGGGNGGNTTAGCNASSPTSLWDKDADLNNYDILVLSCEGTETSGAKTQVLHDFASVGGRAFASHFHYSWFNQPPYSAENLGTWAPTANYIFNDPAGNNNQLNANIVETLADGGTPFKTWLGNVSALGTNGAPAGELFIDQPRYNVQVTAANTPSKVWIVPDNSTYYYQNSGGTIVTLPPNTAQYFSFDTPTGGTGDAGAPYCGRIVYSDLHVGSAAGDYGSSSTVPGGCATGALTPQEKALEYMLLDLASCVGSDTNLPNPPATCTPLKACPTGFVCGSYPDGCGGSISCGNCATGASCVGGKCVTCTPLKACPSGVVCGDWPDGCGGSIVCGTCPITQACVAGVCTTGCTPVGCPAGVTCGPAGNGCGGTISSCGTCAPGTTCGGGGTPGVCGAGDANACVPQACPPSIQCGPTGDGCGGLINCGTCTPPQTCGGGGTPGVCGAPNCTPATCASLGANCGQVADGCGGLTANCGTCTGNATCGGGGTSNVCGVPPCTPTTCAKLGVNCGLVADGCGAALDCGACTAPDTCGGGGVANICGTGGSPK